MESSRRGRPKHSTMHSSDAIQPDGRWQRSIHAAWPVFLSSIHQDTKTTYALWSHCRYHRWCDCLTRSQNMEDVARIRSWSRECSFWYGAVCRLLIVALLLTITEQTLSSASSQYNIYLQASILENVRRLSLAQLCRQPISRSLSSPTICLCLYRTSRISSPSVGSDDETSSSPVLVQGAQMDSNELPGVHTDNAQPASTDLHRGELPHAVLFIMNVVTFIHFTLYLSITFPQKPTRLKTI